jgi:hypothetical protein
LVCNRFRLGYRRIVGRGGLGDISGCVCHNSTLVRFREMRKGIK